jgi:hypothetical protein
LNHAKSLDGITCGIATRKQVLKINNFSQTHSGTEFTVKSVPQNLEKQNRESQLMSANLEQKPLEL